MLFSLTLLFLKLHPVSIQLRLVMMGHLQGTSHHFPGANKISPVYVKVLLYRKRNSFIQLPENDWYHPHYQIFFFLFQIYDRAQADGEKNCWRYSPRKNDKTTAEFRSLMGTKDSGFGQLLQDRLRTNSEAKLCFQVLGRKRGREKRCAYKM